MTAQIIQFPPYRVQLATELGCPRCGGSDGTLNLRAAHWGTCNTHGLKWLIGEDLFQNWRQENDRVWFENAVFLQGFETVEPVRRWRP